MKYSDLYDFAPIGLFAFDTQGLILEVNLAGAKLLGEERRNLMNRRFQMFVSPKDRPIFDEFCKSAFEISIKQTCELNLLRDGKPTVYARIEGTVAEDRPLNERSCRIVVDITERKRAEEMLLKAKEAAEEATKVKAAFMANMSNELRTSMNSVIGFTSILLEEPLTPEQRDFVESIRNSGGALLALINDILDFSNASRRPSTWWQLRLQKKAWTLRIPSISSSLRR